ncbi:hypothetical protein N9F38_00260 [Flavobacteriaceae bacterium]|nr:hypothetical protein [Flavobacteriaceae bacterium]
MSKIDPNNTKELKEYLASLSPEYVEKRNQEEVEENKEMFAEFKDAFSKSCCFLCGNKLDTFYDDEPCFHWFLRPNGIRKKHFKSYLSEPIGFFRLESYLRWVATTENFIKNINDLESETSKSKIREVTIKYKNIEWSLHFGKTDLAGHSPSKNADFPHFHMQMLIDNNPFIRFNDFHIPFSKYDLIDIKLMDEASDLIKFGHSQAPGMSVIEDDELLSKMDELMVAAENMDSATFNTQTMAAMPEGMTMDGDKLQLMFKENKETKVPLRHLMKKYFPEVNLVTNIEPPDGFPDKKTRNKR